MEPTGIIFAALDCDADSIEAWNRWYDLEHTPMNVCLDGVLLSRRYVSPPDCHAARTGTSDAFTGGKATFLTTYVLTGDPQRAFDAMSTELPKLYDEGRMTFPAEKKAVREGDVFVANGTQGPAILQPKDVPFVGHSGVIVVQHDGSQDRAAALSEQPGVTGVWSHESRNRPGLHLDLVFVEDDPAGRAEQLRQAVPHRTEPILDAPFLLIDPLRYPWADAIRASDLPKTVS